MSAKDDREEVSDVFKDNPDLWTTGSFKEIARMIEQEWWEDKRKQLSKLSGSMDTELIEFLPADLQKKLLGREISPEEFDEELPDDSFLWQTFKRNKGKGYEVVASNKIVKDCKKLTPKEKDETLVILHSLSAEPSGSSLPRPQNVKPLGRAGSDIKLENVFGIKKKRGQTAKTKIFQYKCGRGLRKRLLWIIEPNIKKVVLIFFGTRTNMENIW